MTVMLDERKIKILTAIIDDYIATAEPIGSRTIARKYHIGISPATIRNEMADLEELGYLSQPHTSAGRVPSQKGYRYYVDFLLPSKKLSEYENIMIRKIFNKRASELEELVDQAAEVISRLTSYTTITLGPQLKACQLKHIQITRIDDSKGLLLMLTNYGSVSHHVIEIPQNFNDSDLIRISNILNDNLAGKNFSGITNEIIESIKNEMIEYDEILNILLEILIENLEDSIENTRIISAGRSKMLEHPEFQNVEKAKKFLSLLEQRDLIINALKDISKPNTINVTIGNENPRIELQDFSIITANIAVDKKNLGLFGIMGPTRMEYSKAISILAQVTEYLSRILSAML